MKINKIVLQNFKCFKKVDLNLAPITLLTGANSSGKSSFIYSVLAMLQTEFFPFYFSPNGNYVNMGSFDEIVFNHELGRKIEISGTIKNERELNQRVQIDFKTIWDKNPENELPQLEHLQLQTEELELTLTHKDKYFLNLKIDSEEYDISEFKKWLVEVNILKSTKGTNSESAIEIQNAEFKDLDEFFEKFLEIAPPLAVAGFSEPMFDTFRQLNDSFNYIGSFRQSPERTYYQKAKSKFKVDVSGEGYIDQILEWEEKKSGKFEKLNAIMKELQLFSEIKSQKINGGRFEFKVKTHEQGILASLTDVGFGISQFLPIVVADLQLPDNSVLTLSQPEMHLHPKIQAALGSYFVKQIKKNEKQYIVETHSEYLLNRIRLAIVKGEIASKDVALYYFENSLEGSKSYNIELTQDGQVKNAPESFFDTYMIDTMDIAMNALEG